MKNIIKLLLFLCFSLTFSQVVIGGQGPVTNNSVSLEFGTGNKGLVLPWANTQIDLAQNYIGLSDAVAGTMIFDISDYRFKILKGNSVWEFLSDSGSGSNGNESTIPITGTTGTNVTTNRTIQDNKTENTNAKTSIGLPASPSVPGVLVLEDSNKAMILPKVASPHLNIKNPAPGMLVYDTDHHLVAFFNGTVWSFMK